MRFKQIISLLLISTCCACVPTVSNVLMPDNKWALGITCRYSVDCFVEATHQCSHGYELLSNNEHNLIVRCR